VNVTTERTTEPDRSSQAESKFLWPPIVICVVVLWLAPMGTSLGLDESGTWWVVKDGLQETMARARIWPAGQSLVFDVLLLASRAVVGESEFAFRVPSVLAMGAALYLLYRLGRRMFGPLAAMFSCLAFITLRDVVYVASTVRPYALGLFFVTGAMLALMNWIDTGKLRYGLTYVLLAALTVHAHYLFGVMFVIQALYFFVRTRDGSSAVRVPQMLLAWVVSALLMLPLLPFVLSLNSGRMRSIYLPTPSTEALLGSLAPGLLLGALAAALLFRLIARRPISISGAFRGTPAWLAAAWALIPPVVIFLISLLTPVKLFAPRYYIASAPGIALLAGWIFRMMGPRAFRHLIVGVITVSAVIAFGVDERFARGTTDWRGAVRAINEHIGAQSTVVLVPSGFAEAGSLDSVLTGALRQVLLAPVIRYPLAGRVIPLPSGLTPEAVRYLEQTVQPSIASASEFFILGLSSEVPFENFLAGRCASMGFVTRVYGYYDGVKVTLFRREPSTVADR
jgi:4-amino-4-deoxy-L-arabinose transferase-like glycosyltransferase